jgi:hypothetical protein
MYFQTKSILKNIYHTLKHVHYTPKQVSSLRSMLENTISKYFFF